MRGAALPSRWTLTRRTAMADPIRVAVTFRLDDAILDEIRAVDPRVELIEVPLPWLRQGAELSAEERDDLARKLAPAEVIFGPNNVPADIVRALPSLRWLQVTTAGVDRMVNDGLLGAGFTVTKVSGLAGPAIAEYVMGVILMLAKGLHTSVRDQAAEQWNFRFTGELAGKTIGIVGMGAIGTETARRAAAFGMRIIGTRRRPSSEDPGTWGHDQLPRLLAESDYVVLCMPLTDETRGLIGARELAMMKPTASIVNVARGPVIDQEALLRALDDGTIAAAALDVHDPEPLPAGHPLWSRANVILTPHISGAVEGYGHRAAAIFIENLRRYAAGQPLANVVDPDLSY